MTSSSGREPSAASLSPGGTSRGANSKLHHHPWSNVEVPFSGRKASTAATCLALLCVLVLGQYAIGRAETSRTTSLRRESHRSSRVSSAFADDGNSSGSTRGHTVGVAQVGEADWRAHPAVEVKAEEDGEDAEGEDEKEDGLPRILTVLTTYSKRAGFVKAYKERVWDREDGDRLPLFIVSDADDPDLEEVVDFRIGSSRGHRLLPAVAEACMRYGGTFDWLAIGDDDTVFMYNRAKAFLKHIDHTQPVAFGRVDGLNGNSAPCEKRKCFSPQDKRNASLALASQGCCDDFSRPCHVPVYPSERDTDHVFSYEDYGPGGLFWPYGGSGTFVSAGLAMAVVGGERGWSNCASIFGVMNTDVQFAQCIKMHGYSMGRYPEGFAQMETSDPGQIRASLADDCQVMGVHLGIKHVVDGSNYTADSFGDAVAAVRDVDLGWGAGGTDAQDLDALCHESWAALTRYDEQSSHV